MKTPLQKLIDWCTKNAMYIDTPIGSLLAIDYDEMRKLFPTLEQEERDMVINTCVEVVKRGTKKEGLTKWTRNDKRIVTEDATNYFNQKYTSQTK
jgi:hypothetical protein